MMTSSINTQETSPYNPVYDQGSVTEATITSQAITSQKTSLYKPACDQGSSSEATSLKIERLENLVKIQGQQNERLEKLVGILFYEAERVRIIPSVTNLIDNGDEDSALFLLSSSKIDVKWYYDEYGYRSKQTLLHIASKKGCLKVVEYLLKDRLNVNRRCSEHYTPLHYAAAYNRPKIIKLLVNKGAELNSFGGVRKLFSSYEKITPLQLASKKGHLESVKTLVELGAKINLKSEGEDKTAAEYAVQNAHYEIFKYLSETKRKN